jgi:hypothetical protein
MSDLEPFPELVESRRLDPNRINGVDQALLTIGGERDAMVTFRDEVAALQNVLGVYLIDPDGTIRDPEIVFARIEHADPLPGLSGVRPGGGPLEPGESVALTTLYPAADLEPGQQFALFVVADGADLNPRFIFDGSGRFEFVNTATGGPANVADSAAQIELRHVADDGTVRTVEGAIFHTADNDPDRLENNLNPSGAERVVSGVDVTSGALVLGLEDLIDFDFNDVVLDLGPVVVPPPIFTPPASLADLDGSNGFRLEGIDAGDESGGWIAGAGDVNGDGFDDVIIGAASADSAGASYVVFGKASGSGASIDLAGLDGNNGFRLDGIDPDDRSGGRVAAAGDFNGDGIHDVIIGAPLANSSSGESSAGESYVVFGSASGFSASIALASLNGNNGFRLGGIDAYDRSGNSVAGVADVNGDGFDDIIIGARNADPDGDVYAGESYVVFGRASGFGGSLELAAVDGINGFRLDGIEREFSGYSVGSAGDVNGDGFDDVIIGAPYADAESGKSYVVFGSASGFGASIDLATLDGTNGFRLAGIDAYDQSGHSVAGAGDVNGDGFEDLIIGAPPIGFPPPPDTEPGESYVIFGRASGFGASIELATLDGTSGFRLAGIDPFDDTGVSVDGAGDVNGDGFDDLIVGAGSADPNGNPSAGESYIVFGKASGFGASIDLATLDGTNGFRLDGIDVRDYSGRSVAGAGDVNGDGFDDLIIGAALADPGGDSYAGESYVVFGGNFTGAVSQLGGPGDDTLTGTSGVDVLLGAQGDDTLLGNGGIDVLNGGADDDLLALLDPAFLEGFGAGGGRVLGGTGSDTLRLDGVGTDLDLGAIPDPRVQDIESIDLHGDGNSLALDVREILNLDDDSNTLTVLGDETNAVSGSLPSATESTATVGGVDFASFTVGAAELLVQTGVDTSGVDTAVA